MEIELIETYLRSNDSQERLKAITELRKYDPEVAVPLLLTKKKDREFLVRSFVAMGLGRKQNAESFAALLELSKFDRDPNVRAEACNSLSLFGKVAAPHLLVCFTQDEHWLVRRSILAALIDLNSPDEMYEVCFQGMQDEDLTVRETAIVCLGSLANTHREEEALANLLIVAQNDSWRLRIAVARALSKFERPSAREMLLKLREDTDYRVVGAVLENLIN
jgi:HEAT repeat protein